MTGTAKLTLKRFTKSKKPTIGGIYEGDTLLCFSLEPPWLDNQQNISCIPDGDYHCIPLHNHVTDAGVTFEWCVRLLGVPDRDGILIHPGNKVKDTKGCILVGNDLHYVNDFVLFNSRATLRVLLNIVKFFDFDLEIRSPCDCIS